MPTSISKEKSSKHSGASSNIIAANYKIDCSNMNLSFITDIKPIFETHCTKCHNEGRKGGYNFTYSAEIKTALRSGQLLGAVKWQKGFPHMPADGAQLDLNTIIKIECWYNTGMKE